MSDLVVQIPNWRTAPYVEQWLGPWAMREQEFFALAETLRGLNLNIHLDSGAPQAAREAAAPGNVIVSDAVALVELRGRMQKHSSSMSGGASTVRARRELRAASADPEVGSILLVIDSPGGTVSGTSDLGDDIAAAAKKKPVVAYIEDLGASAAYWAASQATQVLCGPTALVGSIGTYGVVEDLSAMAAKEGVKVHVVRVGAMKGAGVPGTEVTAEQLADFQREVNTLNEFFLAAVSRGRKLSIDKVRELADGRVWVGQEAADRGLVDGIGSLDAAFESARALSRKSARKKEPNMSAATYAEIVAECVGASPDFICDALKAGASIEQARKDWMAHQALQLEQARQEAAAAKTARENKSQAPGVEPLPAGAAQHSEGSAWDEFQAAVADKVQAGLSRQRAVASAVRENPQRHKLALQEVNARPRA